MGGRRVRGFVVEVGEQASDRLKPIATRSGGLPIFDRPLLDSLLDAAQHYLAPVSAMLERSAPPNNPVGRASAIRPAGGTDSPIPALSAAAARGRRTRPVVWIGPTPDADWLGRLAGPVIEAGRSVAVVVATATEVERLVGEGPAGAVKVHGEMDAASLTRSWAAAQTPPCLLVGTPRVAGWRIPNLGLAVIVEDGRRSMKDRQTPTVHARDLLRIRSRHEGFSLAVVGPTPSVEAMGWGSEVVKRPGRAWPLVEVIDRADQLPGSLLAEPTRRAVQAVVAEGGSVFLFAHRRGHAAAFRCLGCRKLRRCAACGTRLVTAVCERCGRDGETCSECGGERFEPVGSGVGRIVEEAGRLVGGHRVAPGPSDAPVEVGTERDLLAVRPKDLVVMVDVDGMLFSVDYRAAEDTLRVGARLASLVKRGRRMIAQTSEPNHPMIVALRGGDPIGFLRGELDARSRLGYPPSGDLMVIEVRGDHPVEGFDSDIRRTVGEALVMGPAGRSNGSRWLIQGSDLGRARQALRPVIQRWRDGGVTVRVDVDPIDL